MHKDICTIILFSFLFSSCSFPTTEQAGIKYSTQPAFQVAEDIKWREVGLAKELINIKEKMVIISGGIKPIATYPMGRIKGAFSLAKKYRQTHINQ